MSESSDNINQLMVLIARMDGKLDFAIKKAEDHEERLRVLEKSEEIDDRLKALEKWKNAIPVTAITALIVSLGTLVSKMITSLS